MMHAEVRAWRVCERARLNKERQNLSSIDRVCLTEMISRNLDAVFERQPGRTLGLYWPIKGEFDLRHWAQQIGVQKGWQLALPIVVQEQAPLEYSIWSPGDPMVRGFWNIMVPQRRLPVIPDVVLAPLVGFCGLYRLGHGGGYFDRTLAAMQPRPLAVGIGAEACRIEGYVRQAHDIAMDVIVTEAAVYREHMNGS
jgi:5,10-methenyltetrahydrofolate synthetase